MINPKVICISAATGFVLSFLVGIIAGVSFGSVLLRALISTLICGALGYVIPFIFHTFLNVKSEGDLQVEPNNETHTGSLVDISVGDEPLAEEDGGPDFYVNADVVPEKASATMGNLAEPKEEVTESPAVEVSAAEPKVQSQSTSSSENPENTFRPVELGKTINSGNQDISSDEIDVLPDIGEFSSGITSAKNEVLENTDFALEGSSESVSAPKAGAGVMDTETIAKAIKTALSKDS